MLKKEVSTTIASIVIRYRVFYVKEFVGINILHPALFGVAATAAAPRPSTLRC